MGKHRVSLGPTVAQQDAAMKRLMKRGQKLNKPGYINLLEPVVYEFQDLTTGDVMVFDTYEEAKRILELANPNHMTRIICRNVKLPKEA